MTESRTFWTLFEPYHALTYFASEAAAAFEDIGLRGFWRGYFAGRAAPMGPVGAGVVTACFFGFRPSFVARALPAIWATADPSAALGARLVGIDRAVRQHCPDLMVGPAMAEGARLLRGALERCRGEGRPLFSANMDLEWPEEPHLALWHATTLAREHRGDGHVATLTARGIDPCEAHLLKLAADGNPLAIIQPYRGWVESDWEDALQRLSRRAWCNEAGELTAEGRRVCEEIESATDVLAAELLSYLDDGQMEWVAALLRPIAHRVMESGLIPYPNPIGVPAPA
jgi:hypothetical protein